jgi:hypothetical protein
MNKTRISDKNVGNEDEESICERTEKLIEAVSGMFCNGLAFLYIFSSEVHMLLCLCFK